MSEEREKFIENFIENSDLKDEIEKAKNEDRLKESSDWGNTDSGLTALDEFKNALKSKAIEDSIYESEFSRLDGELQENEFEALDREEILDLRKNGNWAEKGYPSFGDFNDGFQSLVNALTRDFWDDLGKNLLEGTGFENIDQDEVKFAPVPPPGIGPEFEEIDLKVNDLFQETMDFDGHMDPIALDLNGDGINTSGANGQVLFDHDGDGVKRGTGWINGDDGLLVRDLNGNGKIDDGSELFGDNTQLANGEQAEDGFEALAELDSNGDGVVSGDDASFSELQIWQDQNGNGQTDEGELLSLEEAGVASLATDADHERTELDNQNAVVAEGSFTRTDGTTGQMTDFDLVENGFYREFTDEVEISESVQDLPEMKGSGAVRDLQEAASQDAKLASALEDFSSATTRDEQLAQLDGLIDAWAETVEGVNFVDRIEEGDRYEIDLKFALGADVNSTDVEPSSELVGRMGSPDTDDSRAVFAGTELSVGAFDSEQIDLLAKVKVLETFNNRPLLGSEVQTFSHFTGNMSVSGIEVLATNNGTAVGRIDFLASNRPPSVILDNDDFALSDTQTDAINESYKTLQDNIYSSLIKQTRLKPAFEAIDLGVNADGEVEFNFDELTAYWESRFAESSREAAFDLAEFSALNADWLRSEGGRWDWGNNKLTEVLLGENGGFSADLVSAYNRLAKDYEVMTSEGGSRIEGGAANELLIGNGEASNSLYGFAGDDELIASENDELDGGGGNNMLHAADGATLYGRWGENTYRFDQGAGVAEVRHSTGGDTGTVAFGKGISFSDITLVKSGNKLQMRIGEEGLDFHNWFSTTENQVSSFELANGESLSRSELLSQKWMNQDVTGGASVDGYSGRDLMVGHGEASNELYGFAGDDLLIASENDVLDGGGGNNVLHAADGATLHGRWGDNTYRFDQGAGVAQVRHSTGGDTGAVAFGEGIGLSDVALAKDGNHLQLRVGDEGLNFHNWFGGSDKQAARFEFANGESLSRSELLSQKWITQNVTGGASVDGYSGGDRLVGHGEESNSLNGYAGDDLLIASENDVLDGGGGNNVLHAADGATLHGRWGDNTYRFDQGAGVAQVRHSTGGDTGAVAFGEGIGLSDVALVKDGSDLQLRVGNEGLNFHNWFGSADNQVSKFEFASGESLSRSELLSQKWITQEVTGGESVEGHSGRDQLIGTGSDGNTLYGRAGDDKLVASENDTLIGNRGEDVLHAADGATLYGNKGADTYVLGSEFDGAKINAGSDSRNAGDKLNLENADPTELWFSRSGDHLLVDSLNTGDRAKVKNWYDGGREMFSEIRAGDSVATTEQLEKLVTAMAGFEPPTSGDSSGGMPENIKSELESALSANWNTVA